LGFIYLKDTERERERAEGEGRGRERISSRLHAERGALCGARSQDSEIMT